MKTRVLISGGCGFLGSHVAAELVSLGAEVHALDDGSSCWLSGFGPDGPAPSDEDPPRFTLPCVKYHGSIGRTPAVEVVCHLALAYPLHRDPVEFARAFRGFVSLGVELFERSRSARTLRRFVVGTCLGSSGERDPLTAIRGSLESALTYWHRPPHLAIEFTRLPELFGPRQVPENGTVGRLLTGVVPPDGFHPGNAFHHVAFVKDAAKVLAERCLTTVHRHQTEFFVGGHVADPCHLAEELRDLGFSTVIPLQEGAEQIGRVDATATATPLRDALLETAKWYQAEGVVRG